MDECAQKAQGLKNQAEELLAKGKIIENLTPFGEVKFTGSYALDLMTVEDIDMVVINPNSEYKETAIKTLNAFANKNFFQSYHLYDWVRFNKPGFPTGFYLGLQTPFNNKKWKIDIWFIKKLTEYEKRIVPQLKNLPEEKRSLILRLKHHKQKNNLEISSADIYKLVLEGKLKSVKGLKTA